MDTLNNSLIVDGVDIDAELQENGYYIQVTAPDAARGDRECPTVKVWYNLTKGGK